MKKLLLILLCAPLIGAGQWSEINEENISLLLDLEICTTDSINNPEDLPICYYSDYYFKKLNETYLVIYMDDDFYMEGYWCGSDGCSIYLYKKEGNKHVLKADFVGWIRDWDSQDIIILQKDYYDNDEGDLDFEYVTTEISIVNNIILVEPEFYSHEENKIKPSKSYFIN